MLVEWQNYIDVFALTHVGKVRKNNEDSILEMKNCGFFAVSDGMGGGNAGEIASQMIVSNLKNALENSSGSPGEREGNVIRAANQANYQINDFAAERHYSSMGATLVSCLLNPWYPSVATVLHAGDSRLYRLRDDELDCLTEDHTVATASKVSESKLAPMFRGVLTNALGTGVEFFLERTSINVQRDDLYILCSDGLSRMVTDQEIQQICVPLINAPSKQICQTLIETALDNGGRDNVSVIVLKIKKLWKEYSPSRKEAESEANAQTQNLMDLSETPQTEIIDAALAKDNQ